MPEKIKPLRHPIPSGPREVVIQNPGKKNEKTIAGDRPMIECRHTCVHCGAPLKEAS